MTLSMATYSRVVSWSRKRSPLCSSTSWRPGSASSRRVYQGLDNTGPENCTCCIILGNIYIYRGYICIEKWSQIFVSGIGSVHSESEEKSLFKLKKGLFLTFRMGTSNARNKNLRPLFNTNIPPISGKYGLRNHFWSLESGFLMRKREENDFFSKSAKLPILSFWILNVHIIICQFQKRSTVKHFFSLSPCSCH